MSFRLSRVLTNSEGDPRHEVNTWQHHRGTGIAASLLEVGTVGDGDDQRTFVPSEGARRELGQSNPEVVLMLHQRRGLAGRDGGGGNGGGAATSRGRGQVDKVGGGEAAAGGGGCETGRVPKSCRRSQIDGEGAGQVAGGDGGGANGGTRAVSRARGRVNEGGGWAPISRTWSPGEEEEREHHGGGPIYRAWSHGGEEEGKGHHADVVVMICGPLYCACEELRHRSVRSLVVTAWFVGL